MRCLTTLRNIDLTGPNSVAASPRGVAKEPSARACYSRAHTGETHGRIYKQLSVETAFRPGASSRRRLPEGRRWFERALAGQQRGRIDGAGESRVPTNNTSLWARAKNLLTQTVEVVAARFRRLAVNNRQASTPKPTSFQRWRRLRARFRPRSLPRRRPRARLRPRPCRSSRARSPI